MVLVLETITTTDDEEELDAVSAWIKHESRLYIRISGGQVSHELCNDTELVENIRSP